MKFLGLPSRLWLLSACTLLAAPLAVGTLYFPPPGAFGCLILYYFFAETWFAVLFTVIVEIVDPEVRIIIIIVFYSNFRNSSCTKLYKLDLLLPCVPERINHSIQLFFVSVTISQDKQLLVEA